MTHDPANLVGTAAAEVQTLAAGFDLIPRYLIA